MTLAIGIKFKGGTLLASDRRVTMGDLKKDTENKIRLITPYVGLVNSGLEGIDSDIMRDVAKQLDKRKGVIDFAEVCDLISDSMLSWWELNEKKVDEEDRVSYIVAGSDRIRTIFGPKGYAEDAHDYATLGSGSDYGEFIFTNSFKEDLTEKEAKKLAIYAIAETSKIVSTVGDMPSITLFRENEEAQEVSDKDILSIKRSLVSTNIFSEGNDQMVSDIVQARETINNLFQSKFRFYLFNLSERAVLDLVRPCVDEETFVAKISSLGLLSGSMRGPDIKKALSSESETDAGFSIALLNEFLKEKFPNKEESIETINDNLKIIRDLRSRHYPIHNTQPDFFPLVIKLVGNYPPNWPDLWAVAIDKYKEALYLLKDILEDKEKQKPESRGDS